MATVHHRTSRHGRLSPAASTFPSRAVSLQRPALAGAARGANEAVRPPSVHQVLRARFLIGKTRVERLAGHRSVIFPSGWHRQNNTRTSPIGKQCSTTSCAAGSKGISLWRRIAGIGGMGRVTCDRQPAHSVRHCVHAAAHTAIGAGREGRQTVLGLHVFDEARGNLHQSGRL